mgnify:CR=1 FL=1
MESSMKEQEEVLILAIESSCDETAAAVVKNGRTVLSNIINSQIDIHTLYGGVVPEIASRKHIENINPVINMALKEANVTLDDITAIAVTYGPGLVGALLVGVAEAKAIAFAKNKPLVGVHHIEGHISANYIEHPELEPPFAALVVSGGHTHLVMVNDYGDYEIIGRTRDDAAGEAFDKVARAVGLGYPGGPKIDKLAKEGKPVYELAKPKTQGRYDFSFSGLKSSVLQFTKRMERQGKTFDMADLACSFQECALDEIFSRVRAVLDDHKDIRHFVVGGGVSANSRLREKVEELRNEYPEVEFTVPPMYCCTDNASMIGVAGTIAYLSGRRGDASLTADSSLEIQ